MKFFGMGSLTNVVMANSKSDEALPKVGDGATQLLYSDRHAFTVIAVHTSKSGKTVTLTVQQDDATRTDNNGMSESQEYTFTKNSGLAAYRIRQSKDGGWKEVGGSTRFIVGSRDEYHDFSF